MTGSGDKKGKFDHLHQTRSDELGWRLGKGEFIYPDELAVVLRQEPPEQWPEALLEHVCGLLDGSIRPKRGPRPNRYEKLETIELRLIYSAMKHWDEEDSDLPDEMIAFAKEHSQNFHHTLSRHERAARLTSIWFFGHDGHHANILNRISSRK